MHTTQGWGSC